MPSPADPSPWESTVVLGNGDVAVIRPLTPHDRDALAAFHRRQSKDSIYRRYFSPKPELSDRDLDHFTHIDMTDRVALAVESHGEFIAWSSYERWPGRSEAEAAFMVDDAHQGEGIATLMLEHLAAIARSNGIDRFTAEVLADNRPMLAVFAKAGWPLQRRFDSGVVDLDWELATTDEFLDSVERREQRADSRAVVRLLIPRAIAVIGASDRPGSVGAAIWDSVTANTSLPVHAVNPARTMLGDHPCHASVADLPDDVSLAIVAVPAQHLDDTIDACIAKRMRGAIVITSVDGTDVDVAAMVARARRNGLRIIGPSSMGVASARPDASLQAALVRVTLPVGHVAISMQSGSLASSLLRRARDLDLGISWFVSLGDKADVSANDLLQFWEEDTNTSVVAIYTESFGNPRKFARIARRVSRTKPIVAVRTGSASVGAASERAVPTGRRHRGADGAGAARHRPRARHAATPAWTEHRRHQQLPQPDRARRGGARACRTRSRSTHPVHSTGGHRPPTTRPRSSRPWTTSRSTESSSSTPRRSKVTSTSPRRTSTGRPTARASRSSPCCSGESTARSCPARPCRHSPSRSRRPRSSVTRMRTGVGWRAIQRSPPDRSRPVDPDAARLVIDHVVEDGRSEPRLEECRRLLEAYGMAFPTAVEASPATAVETAKAIGYPGRHQGRPAAPGPLGPIRRGARPRLGRRPPTVRSTRSSRHWARMPTS